MIDLTSHFSKEARRRQPSKLKSILKHKNAGVAYLAGGLPLSDYFAWNSLSVTTRCTPFKGGIYGNSNLDTELKFEINHEPSVNDISLGTSLQYGGCKGPEKILQFIRDHTDLVHRVPYDYDIITTVGSTHGWDALLRTLCDEGDYIFVEQYMFSSAMETALPLGIKLSPISMDEGGVIPEKLEQKLLNWKSPLPKLMYLVPTGQNPTGSSLSVERRRQIYEIALKYKIIIVEDEPYYFLQLNPLSSTQDVTELSDEQFIDSLVPSFISMDTEGIVIRMDSFSKILAPGSRLAWIIAQKSVTRRLERQFEVSIQTPSGFTSAVIFGTLSRWGQSGYLAWLKALKQEYSHKRDITIQYCLKYLPECASVKAPKAGMFFTIGFDCARNTRFTTKFNNDPLMLETAIFDKAVKYGCCFVPGSWFEVVEKNRKHSKNIFFRGTYAATNEIVLEQGIKRFANAVRDIW